MKKIIVLLLSLLLLVSCTEAKSEEVALSCGETVITREVFYSHLVNYKNDFLQNYLGIREDNEAIWTQDSPGGRNENIAEAVTRMAVEDMIQFIWITEYANQNGFTITDEEKANIDKVVLDMKNSFETAEKYEEYLEKLGLDEDSLKDYLGKTTLYDKGFGKLIGEGGPYEVKEEEYKEYYNQNFFSVKHIFIEDEYIYDEEGNPSLMTEEASAQKLQFANNLMTDIENGTDFEVLRMFSEDNSQNDYPNGMTFGNGFTSDPSYEEAVMAMEIGEIKLIEPEGGGIYIINKIPLIEEDYEEYEDYVKGAVYQSVSDEIFYDHRNEVTVNYDVIDSMSIIDMPILE